MAGNHPLKLTSPTNRLQFDIADSSEDHLIATLRTDPDVRRYLPQLPITMSVAEAAKLRETRAANPGFADYHIHITEKGVSTFVGTVGLKHLDEFQKSAEAGILLLPNAQGKGVATEALYVVLAYLFNERQVHRVTFETSVDNKSMRGWLDVVAGAKLEGILRGCWRDVEDPRRFVDVASYSILEEEWKGSVEERLKAKLRF
ncbi:acyl-CoA N-acyltransferase [Hymenopellis radicata]|nr:acyl-CoA N-acyltransferase [Hymenopellis radicata]